MTGVANAVSSPTGLVGQQPLATDTKGTTGTNAATATVGSGTIDGSTEIGPDVGIAAQSSVGSALLVASLLTFMPRMSNDDQEVLLAEIISKLRDTQAETDKNSIEVEGSKKKAALADQSSKLEAAQEKQAEAKEKQESASIWDKIKLAFQFLASIVSIVIGTILAFTPGFQALGLLMIAGGVVGIVSGIDSAMKMATGEGIAASCMPDSASAADKAKADMIFGITCACVGAVIGIATVVVGFTSGAGAIASAISKFTDLAQTIDKAVNIAQAVVAIAIAIGDVGAGTVKYLASEELASATEDRADAKRLDANVQLLDDLIDQAIQRMVAAGDRFNQMLDSLTDAMQDKGNTMSRAKLAV